MGPTRNSGARNRDFPCESVSPPSEVWLVAGGAKVWDRAVVWDPVETFWRPGFSQAERYLHRLRKVPSPEAKPINQ